MKTSVRFLLHAVVFLLLAATLLPCKAQAQFTDTNWTVIPGFGAPTTTTLNAMAADGNGHVYAGGSFSVIGGVLASRGARWDGTQWNAVGTVPSGGAVTNLVVNGSLLYASYEGGGLAFWNGATWAIIGSSNSVSTAGTISALARDGDFIYAVGTFGISGQPSPLHQTSVSKLLALLVFIHTRLSTP